jgi:hypothetical protein
MKPIHHILELLRSQNCAMLERKSAEVLSAFLSGFTLARREAGGDDDEEFLDTFNAWVHKRFNVESDQGWAKIISFYCPTESDEIDLFWKLYDQFTARRHANGKRATEKSGRS